MGLVSRRPNNLNAQRRTVNKFRPPQLGKLDTGQPKVPALKRVSAKNMKKKTRAKQVVEASRKKERNKKENLQAALLSLEESKKRFR